VAGAIFAAAVMIYAAVAAQDLRQRQVSNWFCAGIAGLGVVRWVVLLQIEPAAFAVAASFVVFALSAASYSLKWLGGGDVKLITATTLLLGNSYDDVLSFLLLMSIIGSALAVIMLLYIMAGRAFGAAERTALPVTGGPTDACAATGLSSANPGPASDNDHMKVPYAVAVALAATAIFFLQIQRA